MYVCVRACVHACVYVCVAHCKNREGGRSKDLVKVHREGRMRREGELEGGREGGREREKRKNRTNT